MFRASVVAFLLVMLAVASAQPRSSAGPCIECRDCKTNNCFSRCQRSCPQTMSIDRCRQMGRDFGTKIGRDACATTQNFCAGGRRNLGGGRKRVPLSQCENIAFGTCQARAKDVARFGACMFSFNGYKSCSRKQFADFFFPEVDELCNMAVSSINP